MSFLLLRAFLPSFVARIPGHIMIHGFSVTDILPFVVYISISFSVNFCSISSPSPKGQLFFRYSSGDIPYIFLNFLEKWLVSKQPTS